MSDAALHTIRLRGAWTTELDGDRARHLRRFGWPTALDPHERVWLVCPELPVASTVELNGVAIGPATATDISPRLLLRNELRITTHPGAQPGDVRLEVRRADSAGA